MTPHADSPPSARRQTLVRQVIDQLSAQITNGEWPVGSKIPTEPRLVERLGVGRNMAALRRTPEDLMALDRALAEREAARLSGRVAAFVEADAALHTVIVAAAHNAMLAELYASIGAAMRATVAEAVRGELRPDRYVEHGRLIEAIRAGDAGRAAHEAGAILEAPAGA